MLSKRSVLQRGKSLSLSDLLLNFLSVTTGALLVLRQLVRVWLSHDSHDFYFVLAVRHHLRRNPRLVN